MFRLIIRRKVYQWIKWDRWSGKRVKFDHEGANRVIMRPENLCRGRYAPKSRGVIFESRQVEGSGLVCIVWRDRQIQTWCDGGWMQYNEMILHRFTSFACIISTDRRRKAFSISCQGLGLVYKKSCKEWHFPSVAELSSALQVIFGGSSILRGRLGDCEKWSMWHFVPSWWRERLRQEFPQGIT